jgi:hypothetical protein
MPAMEPPPAPTLMGTWSLTTTDAQRMSETATFAGDGTVHVEQRVPILPMIGTQLNYKPVAIDGTFVASDAAIILNGSQGRVYVLDGDTLTLANPQNAGTGGPWLVGTYARQ